MKKTKDNLPEGWVWATLEHMSTKVTKGSTPTSYGFKYKDKGIPFVRVENISNNSIQHNTITQYIDKKTHDFLKRSQLEENDILLSIAGTIGRVCIVKKNDLPANTNQALSIIRIPHDFVNKKYILYYLNSSEAQRSTKIDSRGVGIYNISLQDVGNIKIALPPTGEQQRIVHKIEVLLTHLNKTKEELAKVPPILRRFRQSVLAKAFSGELTKSIRDDVLEKVWKRKALRDVCERVNSVNPLLYPERIFRYIDISSISNDTNEITNIKEFIGKNAPSRARRPVQQNDVVFSNVRTYLKNIALVRQDNNNLLCSTGFCVLRPRSMIRSKFLFYRIMSDDFIEEVTKTQTGTHYPATSDRKILAMEIWLPPLDEQDMIIQKIESALKLLSRISKECEKATILITELNQSTLAKAFRGELVHQDPNDEPAEKLLERIKADKQQSIIKKKKYRKHARRKY